MENSNLTSQTGSNASPLHEQQPLPSYWQETRVMVFPGQHFTLKDQPARSYNTISLEDLRLLVRKPAVASKEEAPATIGSRYCAHDARSHKAQAERGEYCLLRFDIDRGNAAIEDIRAAFADVLGAHSFIVYSTSSATPGSRRWRALVPLLKPVGHELRRAAEIAIREQIELLWEFEFDRALDRAGQHIYLPAVAPTKRGKDGAPIYYESDICGDPPLDLEASSLYGAAQQLIDRERQEEDRRQAALDERREKQRLKREGTRQGGGADLSPIDWFNEQYPLEDILIEAGYEQSPSDPRDWRSPLQTTGSYATRAYEDYFVTLSGSDADAGLGIATRNGYRTGDAFSVFVHFMHQGDRNSALQEIRVRRAFAQEERPSSAPGGDLQPIKAITLEELHQAKLTPRVIVPEMIYADVRMRIAAGGSSKTTLAIFEAVNLALGRPIWGRVPNGPVRTVFITREDSREILVARIRAVTEGLMLDDKGKSAVLENIAILDFTDISFRLSAVHDDVVVPHRQNLSRLLDVLRDWKPDWLICDPLVSFGVGESRVNDAEQGLIEAFRILRNELNCCVEGIHHTGKAVARDRVLDQYAGRGGSALADGSRMVTVMQPLLARDWVKSTGRALAEGEMGLVIAFAKHSYCGPQPSIYVLRKNYDFQLVQSVLPQSPDAILSANADRVHEFLLKEYAADRRYSRSALDECTAAIGLARAEVREACRVLITDGRVIYHDIRGKSGAHYEPLALDGSGDELFTI